MEMPTSTGTWRRPGLAVLATLAVGLTLAACATGPVYRPRGPGETVGYTDRQLSPNRFQVTFHGGVGTRREEVEDFLLRRSAEVTLQAGYNHFAFDTRDTQAQTYYRTTFRPQPAWGFGFGPYYGPGPFYWSSFAFNDPWADGQAIPVTRYEAYAEIVLLTPGQADGNPQAIDARAVLDATQPPPAGS
jgi:hypothetical protein